MTREIAQQANVTVIAIMSALCKGWLHSKPDGELDPGNALNASYLKRHSHAEHSFTAKTPVSTDSHQGPHAGESFAEAERREKVANANYREKRAARERMRYYEDIKRSIPYEIVERSFNALGGILEEQFRAFGERNGEALYSIVKSGRTVQEFTAALQREIDSAVKSVIDNTDKQIAGLKRGRTMKEENL